jgi:hypothetical protein
MFILFTNKQPAKNWNQSVLRNPFAVSVLSNNIDSCDTFFRSSAVHCVPTLNSLLTHYSDLLDFVFNLRLQRRNNSLYNLRNWNILKIGTWVWTTCTHSTTIFTLYFNSRATVHIDKNWDIFSILC